MSKKNTNYRVFLLLIWSIILPSFGGGIGYAQNEPDFAWVKRFGNSTAAGSAMKTPVMAVDAQGNSYLAGVYFGQSFTLDGINLTAPISPIYGTQCGYIAKYNPQGQIVWAKSTARVLMEWGWLDSIDNPQKIIIDKEDNIYICGAYATDAQSIINGYSLNNPDEQLGDIGHIFNPFLAKMDSNGNVLWKKTAKHSNYYNTPVGSIPNEIFFDSDGNINMTGGFKDYISFSPNDTLTLNTDEAGVYLARYSPQGEVLSAKKLAGSYPVNQYRTEHVRTDASGNLHRWSNRRNNNPKILYRYDAFGEPTDSLTVNISATGNEWQALNLNGFAVSPTGDVFIGGQFFGNLTLESTTYPGSTIQNNFFSNGVVFKLAAPAYEVEWADTYVPNVHGTFENLLTDGLGNLYTAGKKNDSGQGRMFLHKYTGNGQLLWEKTVESLITPQAPYYGGPYPGSLCQTKNGGNIWVSGTFRKNVYFAEGYHFTTPNSNSHYNGFLLQYGLCDTENPVIEAPASTRICEGESLVLSAELSDPELTYFWSTPTGNVAIEDTGTATLTVTQPGKYYLVAQEDDECYGKSQEVWVT